MIIAEAQPRHQESVAYTDSPLPPLPVEIFLQIIEFLTSEELFCADLVSRKWSLQVTVVFRQRYIPQLTTHYDMLSRTFSLEAEELYRPYLDEITRPHAVWKPIGAIQRLFTQLIYAKGIDWGLYKEARMKFAVVPEDGKKQIDFEELQQFEFSFGMQRIVPLYECLQWYDMLRQVLFLLEDTKKNSPKKLNL